MNFNGNLYFTVQDKHLFYSTILHVSMYRQKREQNMTKVV